MRFVGKEIPIFLKMNSTRVLPDILRRFTWVSAKWIQQNYNNEAILNKN